MSRACWMTIARRACIATHPRVPSRNPKETYTAEACNANPYAARTCQDYSKRVVSSIRSSRTIWQDFKVVAAIRAKGKGQKAKGKNPDPASGPFALCLLPFAFCLDSSPTLQREITARALLRLWFRLRRVGKP